MQRINLFSQCFSTTILLISRFFFCRASKIGRTKSFFTFFFFFRNGVYVPHFARGPTDYAYSQSRNVEMRGRGVVCAARADETIVSEWSRKKRPPRRYCYYSRRRHVCKSVLFLPGRENCVALCAGSTCTYTAAFFFFFFFASAMEEEKIRGKNANGHCVLLNLFRTALARLLLTKKKKNTCFCERNKSKSIHKQRRRI